MVSTFLACCVTALVVYILLWRLLHSTQGVQEPSLVDTSIPFIQPILRISRMGIDYWMIQRRGLPIYTVRLPGTRLYVVNDISLISVVQRHVRTLSFSPILARIASNLIAASDPGVMILSQDEESGFIHRFHDFNHTNLSPGETLDAIKKRAWQITGSISTCESVGAPRKVHMYEWISKEVIMASTEAMYGTRNPFRNSAIREAWAQYEFGLTHLMTGLKLSITTRNSVRARESLVEALKQYYDEGPREDTETSPYILKQYECFSKAGLSSSDIARTASAFTIALLSNTIPTAFWTMYHIFSNPIILQDCRNELLAALKKDHNGGYSLDLASVELSCPILISTYTESLRLHSTGVSVRKVLEDQLINGQYLLKRGAMVLIPAGIQHRDPSIWGQDVNEFDHLRFLHKKRRLRTFGGGWTLCPGRHLATSTILGFAASSILTFDLQPQGGQWVKPTVTKSSLTTSINKPDDDFEVELSCRDDQKWLPVFSGTRQKLQFVAEDADEPYSKL